MAILFVILVGFIIPVTAILVVHCTLLKVPFSLFLVETIRVEVAKDGDEDQEFNGMNALLLASHFDASLKSKFDAKIEFRCLRIEPVM